MNIEAPELRTDRLLLGPLSDRDEPAALERVFNSNPDSIEATKGFTGSRAYDLGDIAQILWQESLRQNSLLLTIRLRRTDEPIGCVAMLVPNPDDQAPWIALLVIDAAYQHRGLGSEAIRALERSCLTLYVYRSPEIFRREGQAGAATTAYRLRSRHRRRTFVGNQVSPSAFHGSAGLQDWRVISEGGCAFFRTGSFAESARFVSAIAELPTVTDHPPAIDVRKDGVTVRTISLSPDYMGVTDDDVEVAERIAGVAQEMGLTADPSVVQSLLVIPGWIDIAAVTPFWRAALGYQPRLDSPVEDLVDPNDRGPGFWFETMDEPRGDGGGNIHVAVFVPPDQAEARVAAALAAGGHMVRDSFAPAWWTLADAAGNEVDIATVMGRD